MRDDTSGAEPGAFTRSGPAGEWVACRYADVRAVLADDRFEVPPAAAGGAAGTISWLRASVSRFSNGAQHRRRRALAVAELSRLDPEVLRAGARWRAHAVLSEAGGPGDRVDVMARLARWVPMAVMADSLGAADSVAVAEAVIQSATGYFPGADAETLRLADTATARLLSLLGCPRTGPGEAGAVGAGPVGAGTAGTGPASTGPASTGPASTGTASTGTASTDTVVAWIALMIQGCDAIAGLIGTALHILQDTPGPDADWPVMALLAEVVRHSPPVRASRRVAPRAIDFGGHSIAAGDAVVCRVEEANRDPGVFERPTEFDPDRVQRPSLTFGYGVRPCPGADQALMLAAGVVEAVMDRCRWLPGQRVDYEPSPALRIPRRLEVVLR